VIAIGDALELRLVYRSYGGENQKRRPPYFSKLLTLVSFLRAASRAPGADIIFLNDGPIPPERLQLMERFGEPHFIDKGPVGMRRSYRCGLALPDQLGWQDEDLVSYNEDDYLFTEEAFIALEGAARELASVSYFTLYDSSIDDDHPRGLRRHEIPRSWRAQPDLVVGQQRWRNIQATASTFSARVGALRQDLDIFYQCMVPFRHRLLDTETCLLYQGYVPYHGAELLTGLPGDFVLSPRGVIRAVGLFPFRVALNARARRQRRPHHLYALTPSAATHLETGQITKDQDWFTEALQSVEWAEKQGMDHASDTIRRTLNRAAQ